MNRFEAMATLLAAVDAGSLSSGARALGAPLATVSRRISDLEEELGAKLVIRTSRGLELTDAGRPFVAASREILAALAEAERAATGEYAAPKGDLVMTAPIVFGRRHLLPVVAAFLDAYPEIDARLMLTDRMANFTEDRIDIALRIGALPDSGLIATRVGEVRWVTCASPDYLDRLGAPLERPGDLGRCACITFEGLMSPTRWTFRAGRGAEQVAVQSRLIVNTAEAAIDAAAAGLGVTRVLSYQIVEAVRSGRLTTILEDFESGPAPVNLVFMDRGLTPLKVRAFMDFAAPRLRRALGAPVG